MNVFLLQEAFQDWTASRSFSFPLSSSSVKAIPTTLPHFPIFTLLSSYSAVDVTTSRPTSRPTWGFPIDKTVAKWGPGERRSCPNFPASPVLHVSRVNPGCSVKSEFPVNMNHSFWLLWVFVAACSLSLVAANGGYSLAVGLGLLIKWLLLLCSTGSRAGGLE